MIGWAGVVLAGGMGTRMKSRLPKALHRVCGQEMLLYPVQALRQLGVAPIVVVVSPANEERVRELLGDSVVYARQTQALGTGHPLLQAAPLLKEKAYQVAVLNADSPLVSLTTLQGLSELHLSQEACITLLTSERCPQQELGKVVRDRDGRITSIVEAGEQDGTNAAGSEVNGGAYCLQAAWLWDNVERIPVGSKGDFYITSLVEMASSQGMRVEAQVSEDPDEVLGVNSRVQMAQVEAAMYQRTRHRWMLEGVTMVDPSSTFIDVSVELGQDTVFYPNTMVLGGSRIGEECRIGPGSVIRDSQVGDRCTITASFLEGATVEEEVSVGPFSRLRPGTHLERGVHVGNFSEIKNSRIGQGTAMGHFGYVGDATIGPNVNLGAGMVTCNFDGVSHHQTVVEEDAFVGCDTMFIAPVRLGAGSITGAGAVITQDVPDHRLAVGMPARIKKSKKITGK